MKKLCIFFSFLLIAIQLTSCSNNSDDLFRAKESDATTEYGRVMVQFKNTESIKSYNLSVKSMDLKSIQPLVKGYKLKYVKRLVSDDVINLINNRHIKSGALKSTLSSDKNLNNLNRLVLLKYEDATTEEQTKEIVENLKSDPEVEHAEIDRLVKAARIPNDEKFYEQEYSMYQIMAPQAWDITTGSNSVIVGVIDTGVNYNHPDLKNNCITGYDFCNNDNDPMDDVGHGTHVAGIIAAQGNNSIGVAGVSWNTKIMPLKFMGSDGKGYTSAAIQCIDYAIAHGAHILNNSWGGYYFDGGEQHLEALFLILAIQRAQDAGVLFVASAGNNGLNNDIIPALPASFGHDNIISVAAIYYDNLYYLSNFGPNSVDIGAPGVNIYSTVFGTYDTMSGTSMAAPHVTGVAALIKGMNPTFNYKQIKRAILNSAHKLPDLEGKVLTGGILNAYHAVSPEIDIKQGDTFISTGGEFDKFQLELIPAEFGPITPHILTFKIENIGATILNLTGPPFVSISGSPSFTVVEQPTKNILAPDESTTFKIRFYTTIEGNHSATISIRNNDPDESMYYFEIKGKAAINSINITNRFNMSADPWGAERILHTGEFNGDGRTDILLQGKTVNNDTILLLSNGTTFYTRYNISTAFGMPADGWAADIRILHTGDFNGDGYTDILLQGINSSYGTQLLIANGSGSFVRYNITDMFGMNIARWGSNYRKIHVGDFNGDGCSDLLLQATAVDYATIMLYGNRTSIFDNYININTAFGMQTDGWAANIRVLNTGDFNGDGRSDILLQGINSSYGTQLLLANGSGGFVRYVIDDMFGMNNERWASNLRKIHVGDFNGDGCSDLLLQATAVDYATITLYGNRTSIFNNYININTAYGMPSDGWAANLRKLKIADFNGDGRNDIILQGVNSSWGTQLLLADPGAGFIRYNISSMFGMNTDKWASDQRNLYIGDFDGDNKDDILLKGVNSQYDTYMILADWNMGF